MLKSLNLFQEEDIAAMWLKLHFLKAPIKFIALVETIRLLFSGKSLLNNDNDDFCPYCLYGIELDFLVNKFGKENLSLKH